MTASLAQMGSGSESRRRWAAILVFLVALGAYLPNLGNDFAMDDAYNVVGNARIRSLANVSEMFTGAWAADAGGYETAINRSYYRPVSELSFAVDHALYGLRPWGYHLGNDVLHGLISLVVFGLLLGMGLRLAPALLGALWFAVHPVHSEAVHLVTYRTELLAAGFALFALLVHQRRMLGRWTPAAVALLFALGLCSKESAVTLPAWILLLDLARGVRWPRLVAAQSALVLVLGGYLLLRAVLLSPSEVRFFHLEAPLVAASVLSIYATYLRLLAWPWPLSPFYDWGIQPPAGDLFEAAPLVGLLLLVATVVAAVVLWRRERRAGLGLAWWLVSLVPFSHLVPLPVGAAERFLYFGSAGVALALAAGLEALPGRLRRPSLVPTGILLLVLTTLTVVRAADWEDDASLLEAVIDDFPEAVNAPLALGELRCREGAVQEAERLFRTLDARLPAFPPNIRAWTTCLVEQGRAQEAREVLREAARRRPGDPAWSALGARLGGR